MRRAEPILSCDATDSGTPASISKRDVPSISNNNTPGAGYYIVRQSHAHAWDEVATPQGWKTYDPTSAHEVGANTNSAGMWTKVKHLFDFLDYTWANSVIAYDNENRENVVNTIETKMTNTTYQAADAVKSV